MRFRGVLLLLASASMLQLQLHHAPRSRVHVARAPTQLVVMRQIQPGEPGYKRQRAKQWLGGLIGRKPAVEEPPAPLPPVCVVHERPMSRAIALPSPTSISHLLTV